MVKDDMLDFKRKSAHYIIEPRVGRVVQATYRTGEGRKMITEDFFITKLGENSVWLDKTNWDTGSSSLKPSGSPIEVALEKIHVIVDLDKTGLVLFPTKMYKLKKR